MTSSCITVSALWNASETDLQLLPHDFYQKGTLSNIAQDVSSPHGRLWATALIVASVVLFVSMYPFWLYRCWQPLHTSESNPLVHGVFQSKTERFLRSFWLVAPNVGFILTGAIPSLSGDGIAGYKLALTGVHNTCAPLSMLLCVVMETVQLVYGENVRFSTFFSMTKPATSLYGPLNFGQRLRMIAVLFSWVCGIIFVSMQAYLFLLPTLGGGKNQNPWITLVSYCGEVLGLISAFSLPAISGMFYIIEMEEGTPLEEAERLIRNHLAKPPVRQVRKPSSRKEASTKCD